VATEPPTALAATAAVTVAVESMLAGTATAASPSAGVITFDTRGLVFDAEGDLYVSVCARLLGPNQIIKIDRTGFTTVVAGEGPPGFSGDDGPALSARFNCPGALAFDHDGNLYVADIDNFRIRRISPDGMITTVAGSGAANPNSLGNISGYAGDGGLATAAKLAGEGGLAVDAEGNLYIGDASNNRVRKVDRQGIITTFAGNGTLGFSGDGGPATEARINSQDFAAGMVLAFDAEGSLFISDTGNGCVRKVDREGMITTVAGTGQLGFSGDGGLATAAQLALPVGLAFDAEGSLYIADDQLSVQDGGRIRKIDRSGIIMTIAGGGEPAGESDGRLANTTWLRHLGALAFDAQGSLYFVETEPNFYPTRATYNRIRKIDRDGIITTVLKANP
jgi:sugar lactone lactonase YvrE